MRFKIKFEVIAAVFAASLCCKVAAGQGENEFEPGSDTNLEWAKDYDDAVSIAKTKYLPMLVYFYGREDTDLCKLAETDVFKRPGVKPQTKKFVCVKVASASKDAEEACKKYNVSAGSFAIVLLNYQLTETNRIREEKQLMKLAEILKNVAEENKKLAETFKKVEKAFERAIECKKNGDMLTCVGILEEIISFKGKIDSPYIGEAEKILQELEKQGADLISEAEKEIEQIQGSIRAGKVTGVNFNPTIEKLHRVRKDFPVKSLKTRLSEAEGRLSAAMSEYRKKMDELQRGGSDPSIPKKKDK